MHKSSDMVTLNNIFNLESFLFKYYQCHVSKNEVGFILSPYSVETRLLKISQLFVIIVLNQQWRADMYILVFLSLFDRFISLSYSVNLKMSKQIV